MDARTVLLIQDQAVEYGQDLFAIGVNPLQVLPEGRLEVVRSHPFIKQRAGYIDILPEVFDGVAAQEEPIEEGRLPLRGQRIVFVSYRHKYGLENDSIPVPPGFGQVPFFGQALFAPCQG